MARKRLTEEGVRKLKPPPKPTQIDYFDQGMPGLVLRVSYGGAKTWRALYYVRSRPKTYKLGRYPHLSLKLAREKAREFLVDPQAALSQKKVGTFKEIAEEFVRRHVDKEKLRSKPEIERCLNRYVFPTWENRPFVDVTRDDVTELLDQIEDGSGPRQADMVLAIVRKITRWYQTRNGKYLSPIVPGMGRTKPADRRRKRILNDDEIRAVWKATDEMGTYGALLKVALLTAQREGKVKSMCWDNIVDGEWIIPAEDREKSHAGALKLPQAVLDIIEQQHRFADNPYVFPGRGKGHFNSFSQRKAELDAVLPTGMPPWVLHDLRRTARSLMSRADVPPHIAERVLGHAIIGVEAVYDQHDYSEQKADALNRLAALVENIIDPPKGNVVAMIK